MKRLLLCSITLCLLVVVNCMYNVGCGGVNSSGGGGLVEGFLYTLGRSAGNNFTYSAWEIEPTSGTVSVLGTGAREYLGLTGWNNAGFMFLGDCVHSTDGYLLTNYYESGVSSRAAAFSIDFSSGANAGLLTLNSNSTLNIAQLYGYFMQYDSGNFVIMHDSMAGGLPACDTIAYLSYSNGNFGSPVYSNVDEGAGYQYYGGSVVLRGNMLYMVVTTAAGAVHILAYRVGGSGTLTLVRDIDLSATITFGGYTALRAYGNVRNNQYGVIIYDNGPATGYFFVACTLDGSGAPTLAGIENFGGAFNTTGVGPGIPVAANGFWYVSHPSLPSNNMDRMTGFQVTPGSMTQTPGSPMTYDPVQTTNTSGNFRMGFRNQFFYTSNSGADYSFHSRVASADGSVSDPTAASNTAIHDFTNDVDQYDHCRQGRMYVMWRVAAPLQLFLFRATLTDGQVELYDTVPIPAVQTVHNLTAIALK